MEVSDCLVSKSGGLTMSEALANKLPMIIISPIPGQESRNAELLLKYNAGWKRDTVEEAVELVGELMRSPELIENIKDNAALLSRPRSAEQIARLLL